MNARHPTLRSEQVITQFGTINLDERGFVTNIAELGITEDQILALPGFVDNREFSIDDYPLHAVAPVGKVIISDDTAITADAILVSGDSTKTDAPNVGSLAIVEEMMTDPANLNSKNTLDLGKLNDRLAEAGLAKVDGGERDDLVAAIKAQ